MVEIKSKRAKIETSLELVRMRLIKGNENFTHSIEKRDLWKSRRMWATYREEHWGKLVDEYRHGVISLEKSVDELLSQLADPIDGEKVD